MSGPLHSPTILVLYPFRFRDPVTGKWVKARYVAERHELEARYAEWEIVGAPEYRRPHGGSFNPHRGPSEPWSLIRPITARGGTAA